MVGKSRKIKLLLCLMVFLPLVSGFTTQNIEPQVTYDESLLKEEAENQEPQSANTLKSWVSDIKTGNNHVTYTLNLYLPLDYDTLHLKSRRDYICSQKTQAILWGEATYLSTGKTIDYSFMIDKDKLRKYTLVDSKDYGIDIVRQYCE